MSPALPDLEVLPVESEGSSSRIPKAGRSTGEFVCPHCQTSYVRAEHLSRHITAHSGVQKYRCEPCNKSFSRSDVFKRHNKLHERESSEPGQPLRSTRKQAALQRSVKACRLCASLKVKCDGGNPCLRCSSLDRDCIYLGGSRRHTTVSTEPPGPTDAVASSSNLDHVVTSATDPTIITSTVDSLLSLHMMTGTMSNGSPDLTLSFDPAQTQPMDTSHDGYSSVGSSSSKEASEHTADDQHALPGGFGEVFDIPMEYLVPSWDNFSSNQYPNDIFGGSDLTFDFFDQDHTQFHQRPDPSSAADFSTSFLDQMPTPDVPLYETLNRLVAQQQLSTEEARPIYVNANGPSTRHQSPAPPETPDELEDALAAWPLSWNPRGTDNLLHLGTVADAAPETIMRDNSSLVPAFDSKSLLSVLETLRFAGLTNNEYHSIYKTLSNIQLQTYDLFLQLFWQHFQKTLPFIHRPTFRPLSTVGFLLISMISIGAFHSRLEGAHHLGRILFEVTRRGVEQLTASDNRLARSLPLVQSMLIWSCSKWTGSPRFMELAEVFGGVYLTCLRRLRVYDPVGAPRLPSSATLHQRWYAWITWEERRRTGMACFTLETETTALLQLPPTMAASELRMQLPSDEQLWCAPTAEAWDLLYNSSWNNMPSIITTIHSIGTPTGTLPTLSPFAALVIFKAFQSLTFPLIQLRACNIDSSAVVDGIQRSLRRLSQGPHEFTPMLGPVGSDWSAAIVSYHMAQLATRVNFEDLQAIAGRGTKRDVASVRERMESWMFVNASEARTVAIHAAQVVRIIRNYPTDAPYEPMSLFFAALLLYVFARTQISQGSEMSPIVLDARHDEDPALWIVCGGDSSLGGIGNLASPLAPKRILQLFSQVLMQRLGQVWEIGVALGGVVGAMASREQ